MADAKPDRRLRKDAKRAANQARAKSSSRTAKPSGTRLSAAKQALRDQLMVQRVAEGWTWGSIAAEAGMTPSAARNAVQRRIRDAPLHLKSDPVEVVERIFQGYQLSIGSFEALAVAAVETGNLAVAVGAKRSANDARDRVLAVMQATGRMPQEMESLRHLIDIRAIAVRMLDAMDDFGRDMVLAEGLMDDGARREAARAAAAKVQTTFAELMGLEEPVESTALTLPPLAESLERVDTGR